ncbi:MAG: hypothetical protein KZQ57_05030 [gamma proteobacterium symbiont of Lucinoma myriamae]|nr:hypothetical protein [gamma proteobacterium symbiont of Lucinoma myriamae]
MTRLIEIFYDDKKEHREIGSGDLPLEVYLTQGEECELFISSLKESSEQIEKEQIQEEQEKNIYGYIAEDDNHLFFQPDKDGLSNNIFHNDEIKKISMVKIRGYNTN